MRTRRLVLRLLALVLACVLCLSSRTVRAQDSANARTDQLVDIINHARVSAGLLPLAASTELDTAAQAHSMDMVQHNYLDHPGSDGSQPQERADRAGYHVPPNSAWIVVEVISAISADPQGPVDWWMGDDQHQKVLMNPRWREIGAGYAQGGEYGNYWTALFGCRPGVLPTVVLDGVTYTHTEACGDPNLAAVPAATARPTATIVITPTTVPTPSVAPVASVSAQQTGANVMVSWSAIGRPSATDWFGIYRIEDPDSIYQDWAYVSCSKSPADPRPSGTCKLPLPNAAGTYQVRMFSSNGYTRIASSDMITSSATPVASPTLTVSPMAAAPGAVVNVQWRAIDSPTTTDWIGLYRPGDADTGPMTWQYVGCAQVPLDARPVGSCNVLLPNTLARGAYEFRLFSANGYARLAVSPGPQIE